MKIIVHNYFPQTKDKFEEAQHPRGQPENAGQFASKEGVSSNVSAGSDDPPVGSYKKNKADNLTTKYGRFVLPVFRGGSTPSDADDWRRNQTLYAHTDKGLVNEQYTGAYAGGSSHVASFFIDPTYFLDTRTPEGAAIWKKLNGDDSKLAALGFTGAIYTDPHSDFDTGGFEIAIVDPYDALLPGEVKQAEKMKKEGKDPFAE